MSHLQRVDDKLGVVIYIVTFYLKIAGLTKWFATLLSLIKQHFKYDIVTNSLLIII